MISTDIKMPLDNRDEREKSFYFIEEEGTGKRSIKYTIKTFSEWLKDTSKSLSLKYKGRTKNGDKYYVNWNILGDFFLFQNQTQNTKLTTEIKSPIIKLFGK